MRGSRKDSKTGPVISFKQQVSFFFEEQAIQFGSNFDLPSFLNESSDQ